MSKTYSDETEKAPASDAPYEERRNWQQKRGSRPIDKRRNPWTGQIMPVRYQDDGN